MALPVVLVPLLSGLAGWIGSFFARVLTVETLKFVAWRAFILFIVFVCLPIVLYNVGVDLIFTLLESAMDYTGSLNQQSLIIELSGLGGYIANQIYLPQCFSVYMTAIATRFIMGFIPFLR
jgi:hypothetical protein